MDIYGSESLGFDTSLAKESFGKALDAFGTGNFPDTERYLAEASDRIDDIESVAALNNRNPALAFIDVLVGNWDVLLALLVMAAMLIAAIRMRKRSQRKRERLRKLERDLRSTERSMKKLQEGYFNRLTIGKKEYMTRMKRYREMATSIRKGIAVHKAHGSGRGPKTGRG